MAVSTYWPGELDKSLVVHADAPKPGSLRLTYAHLDNKTVTAFATFAKVDFLEGLPCFQVGYAVPEPFRKQGRAEKILEAAIAEMRNGFARTSLGTFFVEAIVGADNIASKCVAAKVLSANSTACTDSYTGEAALQYVRKIDRLNRLVM